MISLGDVNLDAALFDLDGTLIHSHIDFSLMRSEIMRMAAEAGVAQEPLEGKEILEMVSAASQAATICNGKQLRGQMWERLEEIERDGCRGSEPIAGAPELLERLRCAGVKIGIVTRNCRAVSLPLLKSLALEFDVLLTRDDVERCKPDPAHLWDALAALQCLPERAVMIGDHWLDVQAGKECGCAATIGILGERAAAWFDPCPPDFVTLDLREALPLFHGQICSRSAS